MSALAFFTSTAITPQSASQGYGVESTDKFRVSSLFTISSNTKAYAMVRGTVLLQQQANDADKVNLILRPHNQKELKLPIKYIIYRGLNITDFIDNNDLTDPANKVKTSGSELLAAMQTIQQGRAPGDDIPLEALFGNDLTPANDKNIDEFFFKSLAPSSQLFTIDCGIELGNFAIGEIGIEIVLENPEFFVDVELAKEAKHERDVSGITDATQKKWEKDLVRHFVDPAAFYGLHYDIKEGIEYRDGSGNKQSANTKGLVYNEILEPFSSSTRNVVYLDIRNENGYSYNYYDNYVGTGTDADKELEIGQTPTGLTKKEYYTNGWAVHIVDVITPGSAEENEFSIALRVNDNERPLLAGWNVELAPNSVIDPPLSDDTSNRVYFTDETHLLPTPIPNSLPAFTNAITLKVPNISSETKQLATMVKLDYIKQLLPLSDTIKFPRINFTDYIFGPLNVDIPWDVDDKIQWFTSNHITYIDVLNDGYVLGKYKTAILSIDSGTNEIEIFDEVPVDLSQPVIIENSSSNDQNVGTYTPIDRTYSNGKTLIKVQETIPSPLQSGDELTLTIKLDGELDYTNNKFIVKDENYTNLEVLSVGNQLDFYSYYSFSNSYDINNISYVSPNTEISFTTSKSKTGLSGFIETGAIVETDTTTGGGSSDNDRLIFYASPFNYFSSNGITKSANFGAAGGVFDYESILKGLEAIMPGVIIDKVNLNIGSENILTFSYSSKSKAKETLFLLGLTKSEWESALSSASSILVDKHIKLFKLLNEGQSKLDTNGNSYYKFELMVTGLNSLGTYKEVNTEVNIYTIDHLIFTSKEFAAKYGIDVTQEEIRLTNFINETLGINGGFGNGIVLDKLQVSNEEKINLEKGKFWTIYGSGKPNKDLFGLDPTMKDKVTQFKSALDSVQDDFATIQTLIQTKGADLLNYAKQRIKVQDEDYTNKDGILYLSRLIMQIVLKNHPKLLSKFPSKIQELSDDFEKHSRGLEGTEMPTFLPSTSTKFNVLISGFDPFTAIYGLSGNKYYDWEKYQSNSSGNLALALDGEEILLDPTDLNSKKALIKSVIFPVRFREFDNNWVDTFFEDYIKDDEIEMIITFSYGIESGIYDYEIERYAANIRNDGSDNNGSKKPLPNGIKPGADNFLLNTLPFEAPLTTINSSTNMIIQDEVGLDQAFGVGFYNGNTKVNIFGSSTNVLSLPNPSVDLAKNRLIAKPTLSNYNTLKIIVVTRGHFSTHNNAHNVYSDVKLIKPIIINFISDNITIALSDTDTTFAVSPSIISNVSINDYIKINNEIMRITAITGNNLTVIRAQQSTVAVPHAIGSILEVLNFIDISSTDTIIIANSRISTQVSVNDYVKIDNEIMRIATITGNDLTVDRSQLNTSAVSHIYSTPLTILMVDSGIRSLEFEIGNTDTQLIISDTTNMLTNDILLIQQELMLVTFIAPILPSISSANKVKPVRGPGGSYLSNEIFYRVSYLRENLSGGVVNKTGHIHLGFLEGDPSTDRDHMLSVIKESIRHAIESF